MQKNLITIALALLAVPACPSALADGLIYNGHGNGPRTLLTLTKDQTSGLAKGKDKITLTTNQHKTLAGLPNSAAVKELRILPVTTETCTCELANVAVRVNRGSIEVANELLGRDWANSYKEQLLRNSRREEQQKAEEALSNNVLKSMEVRLRKLSDRVGRQLTPTEAERR